MFGAEKLLNISINQANDHPLYTYEQTFNQNFLIIAIPIALIVSLLLIKLFLTLTKSSSSQREAPNQPASFKWYSSYGYMIGFGFYIYL